MAADKIEDPFENLLRELTEIRNLMFGMEARGRFAPTARQLEQFKNLLNGTMTNAHDMRSILEAVAYRQGLAKAALDPPKGS